MNNLDQFPADRGFRMPAEWERQDAIWLAWPHQKADWPGKFAPIPWVFAELIRLICLDQLVELIVHNEKIRDEALELCTRAGVNMAQLRLHLMPTDRGWMRDAGPIYVTNGREKMLTHWRFNGWAKYANHKRDAQLPAHIAALQGLERVQPMHRAKRHKQAKPVVLEGGAIDVNGQGTLITTEECLLSDVQCRNPGFTREDYETVFARYLGIRNVIWLERGIAGDDTHGHVDDITRFVNANTVVTVVERNAQDDNYAPLQENLRRLKSAHTADSKALEVVELPMPQPVVFEGQHLPASYANFLITNRAVLVPTFNDPADREALNTLAALFSGREVVGIHAVDLVWGLGTLHCLSQQEPAV